MRGTLSRRQSQVLQFSAELVILRDKQQIFVHIIQSVQNRRVNSDGNGRTAFFDIPQGRAADAARSETSLTDRLRRSRAILICSPIFERISCVPGRTVTPFLLMLVASLRLLLYTKTSILSIYKDVDFRIEKKRRNFGAWNADEDQCRGPFSSSFMPP